MNYWDTQANRWGVFSVNDEDYDEYTAMQAVFIVEQLGVESGLLLDLGCGIGRLSTAILNELPAVAVEGYDTSRSMLEAASDASGPRFTWLFGDLSSVARDPYDGAWCVLVFQHLLEEPIRQILRDVYAVLQPGGRFVTQWMIDVDQAAPAESDVLLLLEEEGFQTLHCEDDTDVTGLSFGNWLWVTSEKQMP